VSAAPSAANVQQAQPLLPCNVQHHGIACFSFSELAKRPSPPQNHVCVCPLPHFSTPSPPVQLAWGRSRKRPPPTGLGRARPDSVQAWQQERREARLVAMCRHDSGWHMLGLARGIAGQHAMCLRMMSSRHVKILRVHPPGSVQK